MLPLMKIPSFIFPSLLVLQITKYTFTKIKTHLQICSLPLDLDVNSLYLYSIFSQPKEELNNKVDVIHLY